MELVLEEKELKHSTKPFSQIPIYLNNIKSERRQKLQDKILEKKNKLQSKLNEIYKIYNTIAPQLVEMEKKLERNK